MWALSGCSSKPKLSGCGAGPMGSWRRRCRGPVMGRGFEDTIGWLATATSKTAVTELMRIAWRTVGGIVERIQVEIDGQVDRLAGLKRIGIDEISYKRGHKYLTIVVDHDSGRLLWAAVGRDEATVTRFFELLGEERSAEMTHVSLTRVQISPKPFDKNGSSPGAELVCRKPQSAHPLQR